MKVRGEHSAPATSKRPIKHETFITPKGIHASPQGHP